MVTKTKAAQALETDETKFAEPKIKGGRRSGWQPGQSGNPKGRPPTLFQPGQSGNPSGRSKSVLEVIRAARERSIRAIEILTDIMEDEDVQPRDRIAACVALLDRGNGKPAMAVIGEVFDGGGTGPNEGLTALLVRARMEHAKMEEESARIKAARIEREEAEARERAALTIDGEANEVDEPDEPVDEYADSPGNTAAPAPSSESDHRVQKRPDDLPPTAPAPVSLSPPPRYERIGTSNAVRLVR